MTSLSWNNAVSNGVTPPQVEGPEIVHFNGYIYMAAGQATSSLTDTYPNGFYRYNLATAVWQDVSNPSHTYYSRFYTNSVLYGNFFYLIYGWSNDNLGNDVQDIMRVDLTSTDFAWETFKTTNAFYRDSYAIAMKASQVYLFAGFSGATNSNLNDLILLDLPSATLTSLTPNGVYPLARIGASMHLINGNFYLFGGQGLNSFYNDMWQYEIATATWTAISQYGSIPAARSRHAYSTQGDALVIWGGQGSSGMLGDLFIYNTLTNYWTALTSASAGAPGAAIGACMVMDMPHLYLFGGLSYLGCLGQMWLYDLAENSFTMLDENGPQQTYTYCQLVADALYVMSGESEGQKPSDEISYFNLTSNVWEDTLYVDSNYPAAQSVQVMVGTSVIKIAGEAWNIDPVNFVSVFNSGKTIAIGSITGVRVPFRLRVLQHLAVLLRRRLDHRPVAAPERPQQLLYTDRPERCVQWRRLRSALLARHCFYCERLRAERPGLLLRGIRQHRGSGLSPRHLQFGPGRHLQPPVLPLCRRHLQRHQRLQHLRAVPHRLLLPHRQQSAHLHLDQHRLQLHTA